MIKNDTAILLFSRSANADAAAKPLSTNPRSAQSVASFLINRSKKIAVKTGLPTFFFSEKQQYGNTFGERFANAFDDVFRLGFERVIAIGNDCLTVETSDILAAAEALQRDPSVLGSTTDGGVYLIGFQKSLFQKKAFQNIEWQTNNTFNKIVQYIENQEITPTFLSEKSDIDNRFDLQKALPRAAVFVQKAIIRLLQIGQSTPSKRAILRLNHCFLACLTPFRGPPISPRFS
jgi:uncharacterized protein